ncbi:MAG TPA: radical SAM protein [Candidatus Omnitrophota bacterium]|nr:radical SAM protein [Candidatus Omnitrophota bacterium]
MNIELTDKNDTLRLSGCATNKHFIGPKHVTIELNNTCNLTCKYCCAWQMLNKTTRPNIQLKIAQFKKLISDFKALHVHRVKLSAAGETLMNPFALPMIEFTHQNGMEVELNTNAILLNKKTIPHLSRVETININLSSTSEKEFRSFQGAPPFAFKKVLDNIVSLGKLREQSKTFKPRINLFFILTKDNYTRIIPMLKLAEKLPINSITFKMAILSRSQINLAIDFKHRSQLIQIIKTCLQKKLYRCTETNLKELATTLLSATFNKGYSTCAPADIRHNRSIYFERKFRKNFRCYIGWFSSFIDFLGNVYFCCHQKTSNIGNINTNSFYKILNSAKAQQERLRLKENFDFRCEEWKICNDCSEIKLNSYVTSILYENNRY